MDSTEVIEGRIDKEIKRIRLITRFSYIYIGGVFLFFLLQSMGIIFFDWAPIPRNTAERNILLAVFIIAAVSYGCWYIYYIKISRPKLNKLLKEYGLSMGISEEKQTAILKMIEDISDGTLDYKRSDKWLKAI